MKTIYEIMLIKIQEMENKINEMQDEVSEMWLKVKNLTQKDNE